MAPGVGLTTSTAVYRIIVEPPKCEKKQSPAKRTFRTTAEEEGSIHSTSTRPIQSVHQFHSIIIICADVDALFFSVTLVIIKSSNYAFVSLLLILSLDPIAADTFSTG